MDSQGGPERAGSLVIELAARTVIVDGTRVELPPMEFSLLAVLAARAGEVVSHKELLKDAFGDSAYMDTQDLHWRIWNIRQLIGDADKTVIRSRRGIGFVLQSQRVEVLEGVAATPAEAPAHVIRLEAEEAPAPEKAEPDQATRETTERSRRPLMILSPAALVVVALVAGLVLAGSWLAGYTLSQRNEIPPAAVAPPPSSDESADEPKQPDRSRAKDTRQRPKKNGDVAPPSDSRSFAVGTTGGVTTGDGTSTTEHNAPSGTQQNSQPNQGGTKQAPPPPPQPNAQLYHLYNPDSGDHIMTTSSSVANQKQAAGYEASLEGGVFTAQEKGTLAISLDSGSAFVYRDAASAPKGVNVAALYKLSSGDDFFYTTSASAANQAQAQGWSRSIAGYVAT